VDLLAGLRVVTTALNLPGPAACARLRDLGASIAKVEPPAGDPFEKYCPDWYRRLHAGMEVHRIDLKSAGGSDAMAALLERADLLVTAQRAAALARLGLDPQALAARFPRLCHVAIVGHAPPEDETPGHDLTYMASLGLVSPPAMPATLFADMGGAERAVSTALALIVARNRDGRGRVAHAALADAAAFLGQPLAEGLTRGDGLLGGRLAGYNLYATKDGWIAVAALEAHFEARLAQALGLPALTVAALAERFKERGALEWERWAREHDLPLAAVRSP
jgi:crotonobetainyl-CoA:carnitine CoA-transferase CaiB-like acyl-CoA transferase